METAIPIVKQEDIKEDDYFHARLWKDAEEKVSVSSVCKIESDSPSRPASPFPVCNEALHIIEVKVEKEEDIEEEECAYGMLCKEENVSAGTESLIQPDSPMSTKNGVSEITLEAVVKKEEDLQRGGHSPLKSDAKKKQFRKNGNHRGKRMEKKLHECSDCGRSFHQSIHTCKKPYQCITCEKAFFQLDNLKRHQRIHTGEKPYRCSTCGKAFAQVLYVRRHERIHTGQKSYQCSTCGKAFVLNSTLRRHQRIHTDKKPYQCSTCGKAFAQIFYLRRHERTHIGQKSYQCSTCGRAFAQIQYLKMHEKTHTGEKPYQCTTCEKSFARKCTLRKHQRTHTGEKLYECGTCGKAFAQTATLTRHQRIHTKRSYLCDQCGKSFTTPDRLKSHEKTHTKPHPTESSYTCTSPPLHTPLPNPTSAPSAAHAALPPHTQPIIAQHGQSSLPTSTALYAVYPNSNHLLYLCPSSGSHPPNYILTISSFNA